ncbi:hypothetical protein BBJ28_00000696 [Nothophytophthora sp. Chile5]|nr:hypothetical protein BBJ28_00000696 [Nothophytophthora sp. Chile5]
MAATTSSEKPGSPAMLRAINTPSKKIVQIVNGEKLVLVCDGRVTYTAVVVPYASILNSQFVRVMPYKQITGSRYCLQSDQYIEVLSAYVTMVAIDPKTFRPWPGLPKLVHPDPSYVPNLETIAKKRKELSARWRAVQEEVDQLPHVSVDMIQDFGHEHSPLVPVPETFLEIHNSFEPKHLNRNNTIFGGDVMTFMVRYATRLAHACARRFTKNKNMVTVSMNRILFKLPINMDNLVTMHARVCSVRRHHLEVEVEVFISVCGSKLLRKSHTGYFTVVNLDRHSRKDRILKGLLLDETDQASMRTMLKAQHRWKFDGEERKLLSLDPLTAIPTTWKIGQSPEQLSRL